MTHRFFLFVANLLPTQGIAAGRSLTLVSKELAHRLFTVLRLQEGEFVQLFSTTTLLTLRLLASPRPKDTLCATIEEVENINPLTSTRITAVGLLKKESFEEAVHHATVSGATHIQPLVTAKSRKGWLHDREAERLQAVIIAACEQSKNRYIPTLLEPKPIARACVDWPTAQRIGFEAGSEKRVIDLVTRYAREKPKILQVFIGPEGGFIEEEMALLQKQGTDFYQLTPTILRSQEAVCLATGLLSAL